MLNAIAPRITEAGFDQDQTGRGETGPRAETIAGARVETRDPVRRYLQQIGRIPLLTVKQEICLARCIERGKEAGKLLGEEGGSVLERDVRNLRRVVERGEQARRKLIDANLRLVVSVARKYGGHGMDFLDLIQEGNLGLIRAVDKFEWHRGWKLSTYACWWIRQAVGHAISCQSRIIRLPAHMIQRINNLLCTSRLLQQDLGREPAFEEIAKAMGTDWTADEVEATLELGRREPLSLETPVGAREDPFFPTMIADENVKLPVEEASEIILSETLEKMLSKLDGRETTVLKLRNGLVDGREQTLAEVGSILGVTRERVREIEKKALRKLKYHESRTHKLSDFLYSSPPPGSSPPEWKDRPGPLGEADRSHGRTV